MIWQNGFISIVTETAIFIIMNICRCSFPQRVAPVTDAIVMRLVELAALLGWLSGPLDISNG
jgi:hypothetical protein